MSEINDVLRLRIRELREQRGITQRELASRIGCNQPDISKLESGTHRIYADTLAEIVGELGGCIVFRYGDIQEGDQG